jgi:hypothetical protein
MNRDAQLHQLIAIKRAVFVVIEHVEQFLSHLGITLAARGRVAVSAGTAGGLG